MKQCWNASTFLIYVAVCNNQEGVYSILKLDYRCMQLWQNIKNGWETKGPKVTKALMRTAGFIDIKVWTIRLDLGLTLWITCSREMFKKNSVENQLTRKCLAVVTQGSSAVDKEWVEVTCDLKWWFMILGWSISQQQLVKLPHACRVCKSLQGHRKLNKLIACEWTTQLNISSSK